VSAAAWAVTVFDIDDDLIARQVSWKCTMVGPGIVSPTLSARSDIGCLLARLVRCNRLLQIFQHKLQLIGAQLLGAAPKPMA
jgi:hypothetical protein